MKRHRVPRAERKRLSRIIRKELRHNRRKRRPRPRKQVLAISFSKWARTRRRKR